MSIDFEVRRVLDNHILKIGEVESDELNKNLNLMGFNSEFDCAPIYLSAGETGAISKMPKDKAWVEYFLVKSPGTFITAGLELKLYQYVAWIKTVPENGIIFNEMISTLIEEHFPKNMKFKLKDNSTLTILKSYQQPTIFLDKRSNRLFNRVFIDCEVYVGRE
ncbi:hypothetical protein MZ018_09360 [Shewanella sp. JNE10-2]|uniref:hypothetical protein n=1 Tax=unclassified Shewanella TaxID=196818 RepID=UPI002003D391|nr:MULTISPECIES: hypothetical protein [unclassified Shewanella]MCK7632251.1 hypothetical protein [Shewanella sp. JNE9-1]MCK7633610.1 hypothetical protein [Shewanella sp. JNE17]MCK7647405.1 hypothetical protein [Shewanella sp. JNE3-1]MCK7648631.1 hypothetical protein [Shewanella sp. JNE8]MCK7655561.1 hypothetical protein [Shewanella sp. JNE4-1]